MTTATTSIGTNSVAINYSVGATVAEVMTAIQAFITTKGWDLHDALAGSNAKCFRALNIDGISYKYVVLDLSTAGYLITKVYEGWNATTHTGTNLAFNSDAATHSQRLSLASSGYMYVFATPRWLATLSKTSDGVIGCPSGNTFTGCFEISRDNLDEVQGTYPIYAWMTGYSMLGLSLADGTYPRCFALPRTKTGAVGDAAARNQTVATLAGDTRNSTSNLSTRLPSITNPWSVDKNNFVFTPFAVETITDGNFNIRGRFYGIKILSTTLGTPFDLITIKTDADAFYSPTGTDTDHHVLTNAAANRFALPV